MSLDQRDVETIRTLFIEGIETLVLPRFDALETRMDGLETRMDGLETRMDGLETRMTNLETRMDAQEDATRQLTLRFESAMTSVDRRLRAISDELQTLAGRIDALTNDVKEIYDQLACKVDKVSTGKKLTQEQLEQQVVDAYQHVVAIAGQLGVTLRS